MVHLSDLNKLQKNITSFTVDAAPYKEIEARVTFEGKTSAAKILIMICAALICSVGLTQNSSKILVGTAIISPLFTTILSTGFALGTRNLRRFSLYLIDLLLEVLLCIIASTLYFILLPMPATPLQSIASTSPKFLDVIIAVSGGIAATLELTRKKTAFIIPGVAIASSVTSPLCCIGLGISKRLFSYSLGAFFVFLTYSFFLIFSSCLTALLLHIPDRSHK